MSANDSGPRVDTVDPVGVLTAREMECARLCVQGLTPSLIGRRMFISPSTVRTHIRKVYGKLGVNSRTQLRDALTDTEDERVSRVLHGIEDIARFLATQSVARRLGTWERAETVIAREWTDERFAKLQRQFLDDALRLVEWLGVETPATAVDV